MNQSHRNNATTYTRWNVIYDLGGAGRRREPGELELRESFVEDREPQLDLMGGNTNGRAFQGGKPADPGRHGAVV